MLEFYENIFQIYGNEPEPKFLSFQYFGMLVNLEAFLLETCHVVGDVFPYATLEVYNINKGRLLIFYSTNHMI